MVGEDATECAEIERGSAAELVYYVARSDVRGEAPFSRLQAAHPR